MFQDTAAAAIFLAAKVEEFRVKLDYVLRVTWAVRHGKDPARYVLKPTDPVSHVPSCSVCEYMLVKFDMKVSPSRDECLCCFDIRPLILLCRLSMC